MRHSSDPTFNEEFVADIGRIDPKVGGCGAVEGRGGVGRGGGRRCGAWWWEEVWDVGVDGDVVRCGLLLMVTLYPDAKTKM